MITFRPDHKTIEQLEAIAAYLRTNVPPGVTVNRTEAILFSIETAIKAIKASVSFAPIYTKFYVQCKKDDPGAIPVHGEDPSGETDGWDDYLCETSLEEIAAGRAITYPDGSEEIVPWTVYCEVDHALEYPYSGYDFTEIIEHDLHEELFGEKSKPRLFAEAGIVATPKMALI